MEIRSLCICDHIAGGFERSRVLAEEEVKTLPMLSVVQSIRGSYRLSVGGSPTFETGDMGIFIAPGLAVQRLRHVPASDGTMDAHWVFLDVEINRLYKLDDLYTFPILLPSSYNAEIFELIKAVRTSPRFLSRLPALHRIAEILLENAVEKETAGEEALRLRSYVENHYHEAIRPDDLARVLNCSRSAMYRKFQSLFGESPSHYINRVRIRHAELLLANTDRTVGDIACAVGFSDVYYFARLFRSVTGGTAGDYRREHQ